MDVLKDYYERDADRFWDPRKGMVGRDLDVYAFPFKNARKILVFSCACNDGKLLSQLE